MIFYEKILKGCKIGRNGDRKRIKGKEGRAR